MVTSLIIYINIIILLQTVFDPLRFADHVKVHKGHDQNVWITRIS